MKAMIFAAGLGTRLRPITDTMPKALVPVDGRPLLERVMTRLIELGADRLVINVHHFPDQIRNYIESRNDLGADVSISEEPELLETGGAVLNVRRYLEGTDGFLVHNVDILSNLDIRAFVSGVRENALATLLVSDRQTQRYFLFDEDMRLVGWTNTATGEVRSPYPGLDASKCRRYAFAGVHYLSGKVFDAMEELGFSGRFPIVDFYLKAAAIYPIYGAAPAGLKILDVGKVATLESCHSFLEEIGEE